MVDTTNPKTLEDWIACIPLPEYVAKIPAGHLMQIGQDEIWVDAYGEQMSRDEYMTRWNVDPALVWAAVKAYRAAHGHKDTVYVIP
jgi:hypothetical protein